MSDQQLVSSTAPLHELKHTIISNLTLTLAHAAERLARHSSGDSDFSEPSDLKNTLSLLKLIPQLLPILPDPPPPPPPQTPETLREQELSKQLQELHQRDRENPNIALGKHSRCPICLQGPGAHRVQDCPERQPRHDIQLLMKLQDNGRI